MSVVNYPAQVTSYSITYFENRAQLQLSGFEKPLNANEGASAVAVTLARIDFEPSRESDAKNYKAFINRGGFLQASRPTWQLASLLLLLEQSEVLLIDENANLSKSGKIAKAKYEK